MSYEVEDFQQDVLEKVSSNPFSLIFGLSGVVPVALWVRSWNDWPQKMRENGLWSRSTQRFIRKSRCIFKFAASPR